ncbi:uncharacterized protein JCM6883_002850 [Sporobolomyces salmoneus]|uniref:uncharacterized protein n=1 Tax=Sporobolomyces salmoneus TaxID=183962 RepID=UPI0031721705
MPYALPSSTSSPSPVGTITMPSIPTFLPTSTSAPSPSNSAPPSLAASPRAEMKRPVRHHQRSHSSDPIASTSNFIFVQPASPDDQHHHSSSSLADSKAYLWSTAEGDATSPGSPSTVPRQQRRVKLFALTPAKPESRSQGGGGGSSQDESSSSSGERGRSVTSPAAVLPMDEDLTPQGINDFTSSLRHHRTRGSVSSFTSSSTVDDEHPSRKPTMMVRKKSGELVRPSLKTDGMRRDFSKPRSAPATPICPKYVHFDTQLEHVKHFLAQQRPAAVSRTGSPVETETEDEPEAFPFPAMATAQAGKVKLVLPNFPARPPTENDCYVESLDMASDGKSIRGIVRVKNLAFEKWVAVRFTLDHWQTVSEVSADHHESMGQGTDRFIFTIKLQDLLARIEEKTMYLAVRYTTAGREIWDNNDGQNYRIEFKKGPPPTSRSSASSAFSGLNPPKRAAWSVTNAGQAADRMADLRRELDRLVKEDSFDNDDVGDVVEETRSARPHRLDARSLTEGSPYSFSNALKMYTPAEKRVVSSPQPPTNVGSSLTAFFDPVSTSPQRPKTMPSTTSPSKKAAYPGNLTGGMPVSPCEGNSPVINSHPAPALSPRPHLQPDFGLPSTSSKSYYSPTLYGSSVQQPSIPSTESTYYGPAPTNYFSTFLPLQDETTHGNSPDHTPTPPSGHGSGSSSPHVRYASYPVGSQGHGLKGLHASSSSSAPLISPKTTFKPLVPPPFRDSKGASPFASPANSPAISPAGSPPRVRSPALVSPPSEESLWSPSASSTDSVVTSSSRRSEDSTNSLLSSPESDATSVPDSPASSSLQLGKDKSKSKGPRPSNALEFSHFLDRYRFHLNANGSASSLGLSAPANSSQQDFFDFSSSSMNSSRSPTDSTLSSALSSATSSPTLGAPTPRRLTPLPASCGAGSVTPPKSFPDERSSPIS